MEPLRVGHFYWPLAGRTKHHPAQRSAYWPSKLRVSAKERERERERDRNEVEARLQLTLTNQPLLTLFSSSSIRFVALPAATLRAAPLNPTETKPTKLNSIQFSSAQLSSARFNSISVPSSEANQSGQAAPDVAPVCWPPLVATRTPSTNPPNPPALQRIPIERSAFGQVQAQKLNRAEMNSTRPK